MINKATSVIQITKLQSKQVLSKNLGKKRVKTRGKRLIENKKQQLKDTCLNK